MPDRTRYISSPEPTNVFTAAAAWLRRVRTLGAAVTLGLGDDAMRRDPVELFGEWFDAAQRSGLAMPEAMAVATATPDGRPSSRMLLLKAFDRDGFVFFTNHDSRKARELSENPRAALLFYWSGLQRQVRIEGVVAPLSESESADYFRTRPRPARIGAWASEQSRPLESREQLEQRVGEVEAKFRDQDVPLPPFWGGYRLSPLSIEFWQGRLHRLHDRIEFTRASDSPDAGWTAQRLYP